MPDETKIEIADVNPGEAPLQRAAVALSAGLAFRFHVKSSRAKVIEQLKAERTIPLLDQEYILARLAAIPAEHDLIQLSIIGNPHKAGFNFTFTVCELT